ncbi:SMI1/KNR4 family protein [Actinomadura macrotermitis]|nr:SMI1/KNR4 family protein [Actinomadura macrotermitis]
MSELTEPLVRQGLVAPEDLVGCTVEEIETLKESQGVTTLPARYREFLEQGGRTPYWLAHLGEWHYEWLLEAKNIAREIVEDHGDDFAPYADAFIFQTHQGYMFLYFRAADLSQLDPHVWTYTQGRPAKGSDQPFTQWLGDLAAYLPHAIRLRRDLGPR